MFFFKINKKIFACFLKESKDFYVFLIALWSGMFNKLPFFYLGSGTYFMIELFNTLFGWS